MVLSFNTLAQDSIVEFDRIHPVVSKLLSNSPPLSEMQESCTSYNYCSDFLFDGDQLSNDDFKLHTKDYILDLTKDEIISALTTYHPRDLWSGDSEFQMSYNTSNGAISYADQEHVGIRLNQIIFLRLNIRVSGIKLIQMPVAFKIIRLDKESGILEFSYLQNNLSKGIQQLKLVELGNGSTMITHATRYLSGQNFRDNRLYGVFHENLIDEFYANLESLIISKQ